MTETEQNVEQNVEQNKALVRDFIDSLFTKGDVDAVYEYLAEAFVHHDEPLGQTGDREGMRAVGALVRSGFPDWHSNVHMLVAEGDVVVERFTASGTHEAEFMGVPPTGQTVVLRGINIFRIADGRIVEAWARLDELGILRQLGLVPSA